VIEKSLKKTFLRYFINSNYFKNSNDISKISQLFRQCYDRFALEMIGWTILSQILNFKLKIYTGLFSISMAQGNLTPTQV
jgi:hypothetical protein